MSRIKRVVSAGFWTDDKVLELFSPEDKYFMLYLLTNPHTRQLGIYKINIIQMSFETGYTREAITVLLDRFESKYQIVKYSWDTKEIAIINYLKHSVVKGGKPVEDCLLRDISDVKDKRLIDFVFGMIAPDEDINETVSKVIREYLNDNDNDNDNDNIVGDSYNDSYNDSSDGEPVESYRNFAHLSISAEENSRLLALNYSQKQVDEIYDAIENYRNNKKYTSLYLTARKWLKREYGEPKPEKKPTEVDWDKAPYLRDL